MIKTDTIILVLTMIILAGLIYHLLYREIKTAQSNNNIIERTANGRLQLKQ